MDPFSLDEIFDKFAKPTVPIFKNRNALRSSYVPSYLPFRENEMKQLASIVGPVIAGGMPSNAFLYGKTGLGKTVVAKAVLSALQKKIKELGKSVLLAFINCQLIDTTYRIYAHLCESIGVEVPITGLPTDEVIKKFTMSLDEKNTHLIVVLDEVDFLQKKDSKTLYGLTRINSQLRHSSLSLIGITNDVMFKQNIDARVRSTLTEQEIVFLPYDSNQLKKIIEQRAEIALHPNVLTEGAVNRAAAIASQEHGDARRALDLVRVAGEIAEREGAAQITEQHVRQAEQVIEVDAVTEVLSAQPIHSKAVLVALYKLETEGDRKEPITTSTLYQKYQDICKLLHIDDLTQRRVGDLINELDLLGMVKAAVISKGRYGRSKVIKLAVQPSQIKHTLGRDSAFSDIL